MVRKPKNETESEVEQHCTAPYTKGCPMCGAEHPAFKYNGIGHYLKCNTCEFTMMSDYPTVIDAVEAWNNLRREE